MIQNSNLDDFKKALNKLENGIRVLRKAFMDLANQAPCDHYRVDDLPNDKD